MALYLTNVSLMRAQNSLTASTKSLDTTYQRLSSGQRINSAKDDPAGFMIAGRLTSQLNGLKQASRNCNDGLSVAQTAEGAMDEISNMLQSLRTLAVQASTGTYSEDDRKALTRQAAQLCDEITRISCSTTYAGARILCGVSGLRAGESSLFNANGSITIQAGAYQGDKISINGLKDGFSMASLAAQLNITAGTPGYLVDSDGIARFSLSTMDNAEAAIGFIDQYIKQVDSARSDLGAVQNRLESAIRLNDNCYTNLSDARSRIMDTDYAEETANLVRQNILQQMAMVMMQRAMEHQNIILKLLQG